MSTGPVPGLRLRGATAAAFLLFASAFLASGAPVGGGYWPALGTAHIVVRGGGLKPQDLFANLRFDFDGSPSDPSGTGTVRFYDAIGQSQVAQVPFQWTTGRGAAFKAVLSDADFGDFIAARIAELTGGTAAVTIEKTGVKGVLHHAGAELKVSLAAAGEVSLDGGESRSLRVSVHAR